MKPVSDHSLLAILENRGPVTDPALLAQLNGEVEKSSTLKNIVLGGLKGTSDIGATLLRPLDATGITGTTNEERRESLKQFFDENADPGSLAFKGGEIGTQIAGTAGVGGVLAKGATAIPALAKFAPAIQSGGFNLGNAKTQSKLANALMRTGSGAVTGGATLGLVNPEETDIGAMFGAAMPVGGKLAGLLGRAIRPVRSTLSDEAAGLAAKAAQQDIPLTVAQKTGSKPLKWIEAAMEDMPFTAGKAETAKDLQRSAFNRAVLKTVGQNADAATPDVLNAARTRIGGQFEKLSNNTLIPLGERFENQLAIVKASLNEFSPSSINSALDKAKKLAKDGFITGTSYQKVRSSLGKASNDAFRSGQSERGQALKSIKTALDEAAEEVMDKATKGEWSRARKQWQNLKVLEKAAAPTTTDAVSGNVSPAKLAQALMSVDKKGFTYGTRGDDLSDLARIGQAFLKDLPNSGTAPRTFYQSILQNPWEAATTALKGGVGLVPGVTLQKFMQSKLGQKYLSGGIEVTPEIQEIAKMLRGGTTGQAAARTALPLISTNP